jgi:hypothetical protein
MWNTVPGFRGSIRGVPNVSFPDGMACLSREDVSMPYYDPLTESIFQFTGLYLYEAGVIGSYDNKWTDRTNFQIQCGWLNKANQDWTHLYDISSAQTLSALTTVAYHKMGNPISYCSGTFQLPLPKNISFWWGTLAFARLGIFAWANGASATSFICLLPVQFIDTVFFAFQSLGFEFEGIWIGPAEKNLSMSVTVYSRRDIPPIQFTAGLLSIPS